ncbi:hypothetical protein WH47_02849 [Habropoda laboriosa]|uniref:Uncharacterized protein n=1 Tax=Habropoda laboriosa TaxID=597456 RepID=A0A0L7RHZ4_9HYME|nr:hypothetical protein WH47_02849 [Habropoda laboriosa]
MKEGQGEQQASASDPLPLRLITQPACDTDKIKGKHDTNPDNAFFFVHEDSRTG